MKKIKTITAACVPMPDDNIDTDQIMPARFMRIIDKKNLGDKIFSDFRYQANGHLNKQFILNQKQYQHHPILVAGHNFGCGSSREHAPWGLLQYGFTVIISSKFAEIFKNNSLINGFLIIEVSETNLIKIFNLIKKNPQYQLTINLQKQKIFFNDGCQVHFHVEAFRKKCLLEGLDIEKYKDQIQSNNDLKYLLSKICLIKQYEVKNKK